MENIVKDYQGFKRDTDLAVEKIRTGAMTIAQGAVELGYQLKNRKGYRSPSGIRVQHDGRICQGRIRTPP